MPFVGGETPQETICKPRLKKGKSRVVYLCEKVGKNRVGFENHDTKFYVWLGEQEEELIYSSENGKIQNIRPGKE